MPILRLDINGYHKNPILEESLIDFEIDEDILDLMKEYSGYGFKKESHLYYYIQGFNDKWAFPLQEFGLTSSLKFEDNIKDFCQRFNIAAEVVTEGLF